MDHIHGNWPGEIPKVYRWPYDYSKQGHDTDFIPQTTPFSETMSSNLPHDFEDNPTGLEQYNEWAKVNRANESVNSIRDQRLVIRD